MDYSHGVLKSMCSPFFPQLRKKLGRFLVDKTKLIEVIVDDGLDGSVQLKYLFSDPDAAANLLCCKC
jgi:hypothetical protein